MCITWGKTYISCHTKPQHLRYALDCFVPHVRATLDAILEDMPHDPLNYLGTNVRHPSKFLVYERLFIDLPKRDNFKAHLNLRKPCTRQFDRTHIISSYEQGSGRLGDGPRDPGGGGGWKSAEQVSLSFASQCLRTGTKAHVMQEFVFAVGHTCGSLHKCRPHQSHFKPSSDSRLGNQRCTPCLCAAPMTVNRLTRGPPEAPTTYRSGCPLALGWRGTGAAGKKGCEYLGAALGGTWPELSPSLVSYHRWNSRKDF